MNLSFGFWDGLVWRECQSINAYTPGDIASFDGLGESRSSGSFRGWVQSPGRGKVEGRLGSVTSRGQATTTQPSPFTILRLWPTQCAAVSRRTGLLLRCVMSVVRGEDVADWGTKAIPM